jgi:hypothetical protein
MNLPMMAVGFLGTNEFYHPAGGNQAKSKEDSLFPLGSRLLASL